MPELPEIEIVKRSLFKMINKAKIIDIKINNKNLRYTIPVTFSKHLINEKILNISRRSKYLIFHFKKKLLLIHLGMTGKLLIMRNRDNKLFKTSFYYDLNVLANLLQKSYKKIFNEFAGEFGSAIAESAGDVKYHLGASSNRKFDGNLVHISLTDNPSHLEAVDPVVLGQTRAKQFFHKDIKRQKVVPILIHGAAAFAAQGVVAECFAMSGVRGHSTGGTLHFVINNQIGFTTNPRYARSSPYPSDIAKMVEAPILHVNADDPEAVVHCARIATEFRQQFNRDVVIDMICYRRFGHNEGDEPSFTQPMMYKKIKQHPTTLNIYGEKLIKEGVITAEEFNENKKEFRKLLDEQLKTAKEYKPKLEWFEGVWSRYKPTRGQDKRGVTGVTVDTIKKIGKRITHIPEDFNVHPTIRKIFENKKKMFENGTGFDWATAEQLAFATLLEEGTPVRLSGQDSGRGTFSQRHSVLRDQKDNSYYTPLNNISKTKKF